MEKRNIKDMKELSAENLIEQITDALKSLKIHLYDDYPQFSISKHLKLVLKPNEAILSVDYKNNYQ